MKIWWRFGFRNTESGGSADIAIVCSSDGSGKKAGDKITIWCKRIAVTLGMLWLGNRWDCAGFWRQTSAECRSGIGYWCGHRFLYRVTMGRWLRIVLRSVCSSAGTGGHGRDAVRILGEADYHVIQIVFVLLNVAGIYCIYGILKEVSGRLAVVAMGTLLAGSCMASVLCQLGLRRDSWVFCSLFSAWMLVRYIKYGKTGSLVGIVTALHWELCCVEHTGPGGGILHGRRGTDILKMGQTPVDFTGAGVGTATLVLSGNL